ncbi:MAG TPA: VOC family protein [Rhizomicrobium sp.]|jgi:catechol 2,3-dioxygenase-like lactoylglutathione lyase family enzyme|nr:VOC family protein [Rhizomicrobium sp.]
MRLNQVTLPAKDLAQSIAFYQTLGLVLIVRNDHYARFENPSDNSTLSLELRQDAGDGVHIYFECDDLDAQVADLKGKGIAFDSGPEDKSWRWREAWVCDPAGNRLCFYFAGENRRFPPWRITQ